MQTRLSASRFLIVFFAATLAAIVFRIDNWPLTWVPMYAAYLPVDEVRVRVWDKQEIRQGFLVTTRDGRTEWINHERLNIPRTKFIRLYYERIHGAVPPKDEQSHIALSPPNRWLRELFDPHPSVNQWDWRVLRSLNKSLGREPGDADFIVSAQATALQRSFSIADLNDGGGVQPREERVVATATWNEAWISRWGSDDI